MTDSLSPKTIAIVKATVPALSEHGTMITGVMYERLFETPHIRDLFNHANHGEAGAQVRALAAALIAYGRNIETLGNLGPLVERIAHKHIGYHILPEHYPYVATSLLAAIRDVLGEAATDEVLEAWGEAYWFLASVLMRREEVLRKDIVAAEGGWDGWRRFVVTERIKESELITSFVLRPEDGGPVIRHKAGQYLTLSLRPSDAAEMKRNYSISCAPNNERYRISVKREASGHGGSRFLHDKVAVGDVIEVTPPAGDFHLPDSPQHALILLSGGVGLTPMVSMAEALVRDHPGIEAHYVHATANSATHAMDRHVRRLAEHSPQLRVATFYAEPLVSDILGETHDGEGFIPMDWLIQNTPLRNAHIFLCGPSGFLRTYVAGLEEAGIPADRIHYEFFGPTTEAIAA